MVYWHLGQKRDCGVEGATAAHCVDQSRQDRWRQRSRPAPRDEPDRARASHRIQDYCHHHILRSYWRAVRHPACAFRESLGPRAPHAACAERGKRQIVPGLDAGQYSGALQHGRNTSGIVVRAGRVRHWAVQRCSYQDGLRPGFGERRHGHHVLRNAHAIGHSPGKRGFPDSVAVAPQARGDIVGRCRLARSSGRSRPDDRRHVLNMRHGPCSVGGFSAQRARCPSSPNGAPGPGDDHRCRPHSRYDQGNQKPLARTPKVPLQRPCVTSIDPAPASTRRSSLTEA